MVFLNSCLEKKEEEPNLFLTYHLFQSVLNKENICSSNKTIILKKEIPISIEIEKDQIITLDFEDRLLSESSLTSFDFLLEVDPLMRARIVRRNIVSCENNQTSGIFFPDYKIDNKLYFRIRKSSGSYPIGKFVLENRDEKLQIIVTQK
jgi:hypothetical protein